MLLIDIRGGGTPTTIYLFPSPRCVRIIQTHPNRSVSMPRPLPVHPPGVPLQEVIALRAIDNLVPFFLSFFPFFLFLLSKTGLRPNQWAAGMLEDKARSARGGGGGADWNWQVPACWMVLRQ